MDFKLILLISLLLIVSGCMITCGSGGLTKQEQAIQKQDYKICLKASLPDVCLLGYAREVGDARACGLITDEYMKNNCAGTTCGHVGQSCCTNGDECVDGSLCRESTCTKCGLEGQPSCLTENGELCYDGLFISKDNKCVRCGSPGTPCCGDTCTPWSTCIDGTCMECGKVGQTCCDFGKCGVGNCIDNMCVRCGGEAEPCCHGTCNPNLECSGDICVIKATESDMWYNCGRLGQDCCQGLACIDTDNTVCYNKKCVACGNTNQPCCFNKKCNGFATRCNGLNCVSCGLENEICCMGEQGEFCYMQYSCQSGVCV